MKCGLRCSEDFFGKKSDDDTREYIGSSSIIGTKCKVHFPFLLKTKYDTHTSMRKCRCVCIFELLQLIFQRWDCNFSIKDGEEDESSQRCMTLGYVTSAVPTFFFALTRFTQNLTFQGRTGQLKIA